MIKLNFPSRLPPEIASSFKLSLTATELIEISVTNSIKYFCKRETISNILFYPHSSYVLIYLFFQSEYLAEKPITAMKDEL